MSIDRLRYFAAVVETKNLRQASELVGISPPSMSKAISVLEAELGHKLIHPEGRGIGITAKGLEIYRLSSRLLEEFRRFHQGLKAREQLSSRLRLASFEVFSSYFVSAFLATDPTLELFLLEKSPGEIEQAILAGTVELGITYLPAPDPELEYREIGSFRMATYGRKSWEKAPFSEWPYAIPTTELRSHNSEIDALDLWPREAPRRTVKYQFELLETALQTSRQGLSVLHCPDFIVHLHNAQVKTALHLSPLTLPFPFKTERPVKVYLVGRKGAVPDGLERKLAKFMRSLH